MRRALSRSHDTRLILLGVVGVAMAYVGWHVGRGWLPLDDGALASTAERVLQGELPHRDFDDVYTGGLGYVNAWAFQLFGTTLWSLRLVLVAFVVAWVPALYYAATRFMSATAAGATTLLGVVWSVPNYAAPMPSWYNLFFATFGLAALLRYLDDPRARWLGVAGLAGGCSVLFKITGLYFIAGSLLFLVYQAHATSRATAAERPAPAYAYALVITIALGTFVAALLRLIQHQRYAPEVVQFVVPGAVIAAFVVWTEWTLPAGSNRARFGALARIVAPFLIGVAIPVAVFLIPYVRADAVGHLVHGVFVLPMKRFAFATLRAPGLWTSVAVLPLIIVLAGALIVRQSGSRLWLAGIILVVASLLALALWNDTAYRFVWYSARNLVPLLVVIGTALLARRPARDSDARIRRARLLALIAVTALCSLIQFPYAAGNYFCYVAPLVALSAGAILASLPRLPTAVPAAVVIFYAIFAIARTNGHPLYLMGERYFPVFPTQPMGLTRGGLEIPSYQAPVYRAVVATLLQHARGGYTWASPDCPEIYFLSGLRNPTRSLYDFFDDRRDRSSLILKTLDARGVTAVVLNRRPVFSPALTDDPVLVAALEQRYPYGADFGPFQVRWRQ